MGWFTHRQSYEEQKTKTGLICSHSTNEIFSKQKRKEKTVAVNRLARKKHTP
jgi:5-formaminoimidazole-4-carboxamide-1-beta-D-ribofuranosyl 5'-monophosphate synthetase